MTDVLHINDNNLAVQSADGISYSQGYAWLKGDQVLFDLDDSDNPVSNCRLSPQEINNRYWLQCEQSAIPPNGAGMRHAADLVWQHLGQLKKHKNLDDLVLVVPSHYRESNLQLLLGIAKACQLEVKGLVNKAVVALQSQAPADGDYWHFDVQLHQTVCSRVHVSGGLLKLGEIEILSDVGIHLMQEALLKGLQNNFIQNSRFDPLHDAATEQQLFDQLAPIAMQLSDAGKASVGLEHQGRLHNATLDNKDWFSLLEPFSKRLLEVSRSADGSYVDFNAAFGSAGLAVLSEAGLVSLNQIPATSAKQLTQSSGSTGIIYRTDLPAKLSSKQSSSKQPVKTTAAENPGSVSTSKSTAPSSNTGSSLSGVEAGAAEASTGATHILHAGKAVLIDQAELVTKNGNLSVKQSSSGNIQALLASGKLFVLNDEGRSQLRTNDRIGSHLADGVVTVIHVLSSRA